MTTESATALLTAEEFYELPDAPHGGKMELICGRVVTHMPVGGVHGETAADIVLLLGPFVKAHRLGSIGLEVGFRLARNPDTVRGPDVHFVRRARLASGRMPGGAFAGPPDLAIEIISPWDTQREITEKLAQFQEAGTQRVWVVRPERRTVTVHYSDGATRNFVDGDTLDSNDAGFEVDGFALSVTELFGAPTA